MEGRRKKTSLKHARSKSSSNLAGKNKSSLPNIGSKREKRRVSRMMKMSMAIPEEGHHSISSADLLMERVALYKERSVICRKQQRRLKKKNGHSETKNIVADTTEEDVIASPKKKSDVIHISKEEKKLLRASPKSLTKPQKVQRVNILHTFLTQSKYIRASLVRYWALLEQTRTSTAPVDLLQYEENKAWECSACSFNNTKGGIICQICETKRNVEAELEEIRNINHQRVEESSWVLSREVFVRFYLGFMKSLTSFSKFNRNSVEVEAFNIFKRLTRATKCDGVTKLQLNKLILRLVDAHIDLSDYTHFQFVQFMDYIFVEMTHGERKYTKTNKAVKALSWKPLTSISHMKVESSELQYFSDDSDHLEDYDSSDPDDSDDEQVDEAETFDAASLLEHDPFQIVNRILVDRKASMVQKLQTSTLFQGKLQELRKQHTKFQRQQLKEQQVQHKAEQASKAVVIAEKVNILFSQEMGLTGQQHTEAMQIEHLLSKVRAELSDKFYIGQQTKFIQDKEKEFAQSKKHLMIQIMQRMLTNEKKKIRAAITEGAETFKDAETSMKNLVLRKKSKLLTYKKFKEQLQTETEGDILEGQESELLSGVKVTLDGSIVLKEQRKELFPLPVAKLEPLPAKKKTFGGFGISKSASLPVEPSSESELDIQIDEEELKQIDQGLQDNMVAIEHVDKNGEVKVVEVDYTDPTILLQSLEEPSSEDEPEPEPVEIQEEIVDENEEETVEPEVVVEEEKQLTEQEKLDEVLRKMDNIFSNLEAEEETKMVATPEKEEIEESKDQEENIMSLSEVKEKEEEEDKNKYDNDNVEKPENVPVVVFKPNTLQLTESQVLQRQQLQRSPQLSSQHSPATVLPILKPASQKKRASLTSLRPLSKQSSSRDNSIIDTRKDAHLIDTNSHSASRPTTAQDHFEFLVQGSHSVMRSRGDSDASQSNNSRPRSSLEGHDEPRYAGEGNTSLANIDLMEQHYFVTSGLPNDVQKRPHSGMTRSPHPHVARNLNARPKSSAEHQRPHTAQLKPIIVPSTRISASATTGISRPLSRLERPRAMSSHGRSDVHMRSVDLFTEFKNEVPQAHLQQNALYLHSETKHDAHLTHVNDLGDDLPPPKRKSFIDSTTTNENKEPVNTSASKHVRSVSHITFGDATQTKEQEIIHINTKQEDDDTKSKVNYLTDFFQKMQNESDQSYHSDYDNDDEKGEIEEIDSDVSSAVQFFDEEMEEIPELMVLSKSKHAAKMHKVTRKITLRKSCISKNKHNNNNNAPKLDSATLIISGYVTEREDMLNKARTYREKHFLHEDPDIARALNQLKLLPDPKHYVRRRPRSSKLDYINDTSGEGHTAAVWKGSQQQLKLFHRNALQYREEAIKYYEMKGDHDKEKHDSFLRKMNQYDTLKEVSKAFYLGQNMIGKNTDEQIWNAIGTYFPLPSVAEDPSLLPEEIKNPLPGDEIKHKEIITKTIKDITDLDIKHKEANAKFKKEQVIVEKKQDTAIFEKKVHAAIMSKRGTLPAMSFSAIKKMKRSQIKEDGENPCFSTPPGKSRRAKVLLNKVTLDTSKLRRMKRVSAAVGADTMFNYQYIQENEEGKIVVEEQQEKYNDEKWIEDQIGLLKDDLHSFGQLDYTVQEKHEVKNNSLVGSFAANKSVMSTFSSEWSKTRPVTNVNQNMLENDWLDEQMTEMIEHEDLADADANAITERDKIRNDKMHMNSLVEQFEEVLHEKNERREDLAPVSISRDYEKIVLTASRPSNFLGEAETPLKKHLQASVGISRIGEFMSPDIVKRRYEETREKVLVELRNSRQAKAMEAIIQEKLRIEQEVNQAKKELRKKLKREMASLNGVGYASDSQSTRIAREDLMKIIELQTLGAGLQNLVANPEMAKELTKQSQGKNIKNFFQASQLEELSHALQVKAATNVPENEQPQAVQKVYHRRGSVVFDSQKMNSFSEEQTAGEKALAFINPISSPKENTSYIQTPGFLARRSSLTISETRDLLQALKADDIRKVRHIGSNIERKEEEITQIDDNANPFIVPQQHLLYRRGSMGPMPEMSDILDERGYLKPMEYKESTAAVDHTPGAVSFQTVELQVTLAELNTKSQSMFVDNSTKASKQIAKKREEVWESTSKKMQRERIAKFAKFRKSPR